MKDYRTPYNKIEVDTKTGFESGEVYDLETQPSLTDPSQAMEPIDILKMFSRGGSVRVLRAQNFGNEEEPIPQEFQQVFSRIHTMDKTERAQASIELRETIEKKSEDIDKNKKEIEHKKAVAKGRKQAEAAAAAAAKKQKNPSGDE